MLLNFEYISPDIYSKFSKAFWRYLFLEKGNKNKRTTKTKGMGTTYGNTYSRSGRQTEYRQIDAV